MSKEKFACSYVHRVGRTGRAGSSGTAITLLTPADKPLQEELAASLASRASSQGQEGSQPACTDIAHLAFLQGSKLFCTLPHT